MTIKQKQLNEWRETWKASHDTTGTFDELWIPETEVEFLNVASTVFPLLLDEVQRLNAELAKARKTIKRLREAQKSA